jgi:exopolysaccharide production protein ExoZ
MSDKRTENGASVMRPRFVEPAVSAPRASAVDTPKRSQNYRLQYLRAIAASSVVLYHSSLWLETIRHESAEFTLFFGWFGVFGVQLFFAISGLLMARLAGGMAPGRFLAHRIIRIYPIYWLTALVAFFALKAAHLPPALAFNPWTLSLAPGFDSGFALGVEWTLPFEISFYLLITIIIMVHLQRYIPFIATIWLCLIFGSMLLHLSAPPTNFPLLPGLLLTAHCAPFAAGLLATSAIKHNLIPRGAGWIGAGLTIAVNFAPFAALQSFLFAFGCFLLVADASRPRKQAEPNPIGWCASLGDWSYALYLCHVPIILILFNLAPARVNAHVLWATTLALVFLFTSLWGRIDILLHKKLKHAIDQAPLALSNGVCVALVVTLLAALAQVNRATSEAVFAQRFYAARAARANALGQNIGSDLADSKSAAEDRTQIAAALKGRGWTSSQQIAANLDTLAPEGVSWIANGWAFDKNASAQENVVLFFHGPRFLGVAVPALSRADVRTAFHLSDDKFGYSGAISGLKECKVKTLSLVVADYSNMTFNIIDQSFADMAISSSCE